MEPTSLTYLFTVLLEELEQTQAPTGATCVCSVMSDDELENASEEDCIAFTRLTCASGTFEASVFLSGRSKRMELTYTEPDSYPVYSVAFGAVTEIAYDAMCRIAVTHGAPAPAEERKQHCIEVLQELITKTREGEHV